MNSRLLSFPNSFAVIFGRRFLISRFFNHFFRSLAAPPSTFRAFAAGVATLLAVPSRLPRPSTPRFDLRTLVPPLPPPLFPL
jgi:hypothetical protein